MDSRKYIGMDVHKESISIAVRNGAGKIVMECLIETKASELDGSYLSNFEPHAVGSSEHVEYWIPAESLSSFNDAIRGLIRLENGFFGAAFTVYVPGCVRLERERRNRSIRGAAPKLGILHFRCCLRNINQSENCISQLVVLVTP